MQSVVLQNNKMVPVPEFTYERYMWGPSDPTQLSCFMPNGIMILLEANRNATLAEIKEELWELAPKYPLHGKLHDMSVYVFTCINSMAEMEELVDETRRLCDVRPICSMLQIIECEGNKTDKSLNSQISHLIGKGLHEFDSLNNTEVNDFRYKMKRLGEEIATKRSKTTWLERLRYQYPPRLSYTSELSEKLSTRLQNNNIVLISKFEDFETSFSFNVSVSITPQELLNTILNKKATSLNSRARPKDFILKVCGQDEYLVGEYPLIRFLYIQECLAREAMPVLVTVSTASVNVMQDNEYESLEEYELKKPRPSFTGTLRKKGKYVSSWGISDKFTITVNTISKLNCDTKRSVEVGVQVGLFHGGKSLCEPMKSTECTVNDDCECILKEALTFDIQVNNIPRMARICFVVYELTKTKGGKSRRLKESSNKELFYNPLAWVNTTVYDFKNQLKTGDMTLYMWTYAEDIQSEDALHPLGTVVSNPNVEHSTALTLSFSNYGQELTTLYPTSDALLDVALNKNKYELPSYDATTPPTPTPADGTTTTTTTDHKQSDVDLLKKIVNKTDSGHLHDMFEQDKKIVWNMRRYCAQHHKNMLPKVLQCVEWNDRHYVADVVAMLKEWPLLPVEKALELLDYAYPDQEVRSYAVNCLSNISDEDLSLYLLQLVQAIKHESYLDCDLVHFLLKKALNNQRIGHYLFWHLRSEMSVPAVSVRFGLILEAYCRGSQDHMAGLNKQIECLDKMKAGNELVRSRKDKDKARAALQEYLSEASSQEVMDNVVSPLDPRFRCRCIRMEKCRVMDSKMRPLWVVFENADVYGDDVYVIFKNGDDLRQDMLTLQMLRIMDKLWKSEGLDLRMNPYNCISTDYRVGMIEVVLNSETIANIQKEKGMFSATSAFRKGSLLAWLKEHNPSETALNKAIEEFTLSCAGYCVATYVLGVADRHSDNIMVKKTGQLFHIDFGHILGHFKEKFGFCRERVPFVLTHDFVYVINKGKREAPLEFTIFRKYCEKAFLMLRKHGCLILSLCAMMISTGLPELSSEKDLSYLRDTLVLDKSENDAVMHFRSKFDEALCNSWKTSLNWASHNLAKNNKQ